MQHQGDLRLKDTRQQLVAEIEHVLPLVSKPNQYLGNELNVCLKNHTQADVRFALAYPDTYYIGMSHQGLKILYHILNRRSDTLAERVYAPWVDMESQMRKGGIPLFSLESRIPVADFDVLGFTLQHELNFTNVLNMLDLAQIPLRVEHRRESDPLILAGGSCASNPEPLADFIDAFVIGDGEEVVGEIAELLILSKNKGWRRHRILNHLARLEGVYVPCLYRAEYDGEGRYQRLRPLHQDAPSVIKARIIPRLERQNYPLRPLVPLTEIAHDRLSIEIMRGCSQGCRYCHAGMVYRPVREKSPQDILQEAVSGIDHSGWDEISLVSLSSSDYDRLLPVISELNRLLGDRKITLSLPSLRPDTFTEKLAQSMRHVRRTGLTFAPEAGTPRLRKVINKEFREEDLLKTIRIAFDNGWESVKLYFMIGLPTETREDLDGIVELGRDLKGLARGKKELHLSISPFTPKPHTPFQWEKQDPADVMEKKSRYLKSRLPHRGMRVSWRNPQVSFLEAVFARGDRQLSRVLERAWRSGCRFDSWTEMFDHSRWGDAFSQAGLNPRQYVQERPVDAPLPWDHISYGVRREYLLNERSRALQEQVTPDCRRAGCHGCGAHSGQLKRPSGLQVPQEAVTERALHYGREKKRRSTGSPQASGIRVRVQYTKEAPLRFLSHLDMIRLLERSIRRARLPIDYSEGFHPHPKIAYGPPLPLGLTSQAEYVDIQFTRPLAGDLASQMGSVLPRGVAISATKAIFKKTEALSAVINVAEYRAELKNLIPAGNLSAKIETMMLARQLAVQRSTPKEVKAVDIRAYLLDIHLVDNGDSLLSLMMRLRIGQGGHARPQEVLSLILDLPSEQLAGIPIHRTAQYIDSEGRLLSPMDVI